MMGRQVEQAVLFYEFRLEERVPEGHLLRRVDAILDLGFVREHMAPHYSTIGRPSVCPELMVRMLLVGYLYGLRSEQRLVQGFDVIPCLPMISISISAHNAGREEVSASPWVLCCSVRICFRSHFRSACRHTNVKLNSSSSRCSSPRSCQCQSIGFRAGPRRTW